MSANYSKTIQMTLGHTGPLESPSRTSMPWCMLAGRKVSDSFGSAQSIEKHISRKNLLKGLKSTCPSMHLALYYCLRNSIVIVIISKTEQPNSVSIQWYKKAQHKTLFWTTWRGDSKSWSIYQNQYYVTHACDMRNHLQHQALFLFLKRASTSQNSTLWNKNVKMRSFSSKIRLGREGGGGDDLNVLLVICRCM